MAVSRIDEAGLNVTQYGNRNLIINGAMQHSQRNSGSVANGTQVSSIGYLALDRWGYWAQAGSKFTQEKSTDAPSGFDSSLKITSTSTVAVGSSEYYTVSQRIEGYNAASLDLGSSTAKTFTVSFWVKSSLTGDFAFYAHNNGYSRCFVSPYTINAANTWEYKTITIDGPTTGTWLTGTSNAIEIGFTMGSGSSWETSTTDEWLNASFKLGTASTVDIISTNGATWFVTGVQLEVGDTATGFEHRSYGDELLRCQRYYYSNTSTSQFYSTQYVSSHKFVQWPHPVQMRATPTATVTYSSGSFTEYQTDDQHFKAYVSSSYTDGTSYYTTSYKMDAEL